MPIAPKTKGLAEHLRLLAGREQNKEITVVLLQRADLIEAAFDESALHEPEPPDAET